MSKILLSGSSSFKERVNEIFTEYALSINKYKLKEYAYKQCQLNYDCRELTSDHAKILNKMYSEIWQRRDISNIQKYNMETKLQKAYEDPDKKSIYNYYHQYFTDKKKVRYNPQKTDYLKYKVPNY